MFIIVMLCNDDGKFYIDYVNKKFDNFQEAQNVNFRYFATHFPCLSHRPLDKSYQRFEGRNASVFPKFQ